MNINTGLFPRDIDNFMSFENVELGNLFIHFHHLFHITVLEAKSYHLVTFTLDFQGSHLIYCVFSNSPLPHG